MECTHGEVKNMFCKGSCFEFNGMSSRTVEMHMKNIKVEGVQLISCPSDSSDFLGFYNGIMKVHPEWKERLPEMKKYGRIWRIFADKYDHLVELANDNNIKEINKILKNIKYGKLNVFKFNDDGITNKFKEYLIMGSLVPREAQTECDILPCFLVNSLPNVGLDYKIFNPNGTLHSVNGVQFLHEKNNYISQEFSNNKEIKVHNEVQDFISKHCDLFEMISYNKCPHYYLFDENDDKNDVSKFTMHYVEIDYEGSICICIISISQNHKLHPINHVSTADVNFLGLEWIVSDRIEPCFFYDEGIINA